MKVDILYLAKNRQAFTRESFAVLVRNTDWNRVRLLSVYDDGSEDGTAEFLERECGRLRAEFHRTALGSPIEVTNDFLGHAQAPFVAKIDNDAMVPPGWLDIALNVLESSAALDVLGLEERGLEGGVWTFKPARHVGGLYLARRSIFTPPLPASTGIYFGWQEWCLARGVRSGWLVPSMPLFLLDRLPFAPWSILSKHYEDCGWQRPWTRYPRSRALLWAWWQTQVWQGGAPS
jgi:cellulose synthase/poly-beta-1,6-N-acetylglucosamine synthase-like glycosyltransferase